MSMTSDLDSKIRALITELVDSSPEPPVLPDLDSLAGDESAAERSSPRSRPVRRIALLAVAAVIVAAAIFVGISVAPESAHHEPIAAATVLKKIAKNAASQPSSPLGDGQYLLTQANITFLATVSQVGNKPTPGAQATLSANVKEWANNKGGSCIIATSHPATFDSPANQEAWIAAGLLVDPTGPSTSCSWVGNGVMNASHLATNPTLLANELENGQTGIATLDQLDGSFNLGFYRAVRLLIGPATGETPALRSALFGALALMPDIASSGATKTTSGASGVGFSVSGGSLKSTIVVNPKTGELLEATNVPDQTALQGFGTAYLALPPTPSIQTEGGSYQIVIKEYVPVGEPSIAPLPAGLQPPLPLGSSGTIKATAKPGVTSAQIQAVDSQIQQQYGKAGIDPSTAPGSADIVWTFEFNQSRSQIEGYARILNASGLFSSVAIKEP